MAAVIVADHQVAAFAEVLATIRAAFGVAAGDRIGWDRPGGTSVVGADGQTLLALRSRLLRAAIVHGIRSIVVFGHDTAVASGRSVDAGCDLLAELFERVVRILDHEEDIGLMIAEWPGDDENGAWLADSLRLLPEVADLVHTSRIIRPIVTAPHHHFPHLQLADLVAGAATAAVTGDPRGRDLTDLLQDLTHPDAGNVTDPGGDSLASTTMSSHQSDLRRDRAR